MCRVLTASPTAGRHARVERRARQRRREPQPRRRLLQVKRESLSAGGVGATDRRQSRNAPASTGHDDLDAEVSKYSLSAAAPPRAQTPSRGQSTLARRRERAARPSAPDRTPDRRRRRSAAAARRRARGRARTAWLRCGARRKRARARLRRDDPRHLRPRPQQRRCRRWPCGRARPLITRSSALRLRRRSLKEAEKAGKGRWSVSIDTGLHRPFRTSSPCLQAFPTRSGTVTRCGDTTTVSCASKLQLVGHSTCD
jgi:hypothetical protein